MQMIEYDVQQNVNLDENFGSRVHRNVWVTKKNVSLLLKVR